MRQSIKTGVLERRAQRKALYALIATCEKKNIVKALEIIKADKNHYHAARHYFKPFYFNIKKSFDDIIYFTHFNCTTALNFLAFHYLRGTLDDIATLIKKIKHQRLSIDFASAQMLQDFFKLIGIVACEQLAKENKIHALPNLRIEYLYLSPMGKHEIFYAIPIDARHFVQLKSISLDKNAQYLQFFDPRKLKALKTLILNDIKLADVLYFIEALPNLQELKCNLNSYDGWEELKSNSLTSLTLSIRKFNTHTHDYLPDFAANLPNLTHLTVGGTSLKNIDNLAKLQKLKKLVFQFVKCGDEKFIIPPLPLLYHLHLWSVKNLDATSISNLHNLTTLNIGYCDKSDISFLANLTNLTDLNISNNNITAIAALSGLKKLVKLDLSNNNITDISVLEGLTELRDISLSGNTLTLAVYPPLRTMIWIRQYDIANIFRNLEEPQEVTSLCALIHSGDEDSLAIAEQILFGRGWTETEFQQLVRVLRRG
jgi:hypothetical protein